MTYAPFYFSLLFATKFYRIIFAARLKTRFIPGSSFQIGILPKRFDKGPPVGNASRV